MSSSIGRVVKGPAARRWIDRLHAVTARAADRVARRSYPVRRALTPMYGRLLHAFSVTGLTGQADPIGEYGVVLLPARYGIFHPHVATRRRVRRLNGIGRRQPGRAQELRASGSYPAARAAISSYLGPGPYLQARTRVLWPSWITGSEIAARRTCRAQFSRPSRPPSHG